MSWRDRPHINQRMGHHTQPPSNIIIAATEYDRNNNKIICVAGCCRWNMTWQTSGGVLWSSSWGRAWSSFFWLVALSKGIHYSSDHSHISIATCDKSFAVRQCWCLCGVMPWWKERKEQKRPAWKAFSQVQQKMSWGVRRRLLAFCHPTSCLR